VGTTRPGSSPGLGTTKKNGGLAQAWVNPFSLRGVLGQQPSGYPGINGIIPKKHLANCLLLTHKASHRIFSPHRSKFLREYYSPGGGFFLWKGRPEADRGKPLYPYHSMTQFKALARENRKSLHEIILENEKAIMKVGDREIKAHLDTVIKIMLETGKALPTPFKEMGTGGLGVTMVDC